MSVMYVTVDKRDVDRSLDSLMILMSPEGMMSFLGAEIIPYIKERAKARFADEGDDVVGQWAPLRPATQAIRSEGPWAVSGDHPINVRSGELENWVTNGDYFPYPDTLGATVEYPKNEPTGELRDKVETAQKGRKDPNTVARPVLYLGEADLAFFMTALSMNIEAAML